MLERKYLLTRMASRFEDLFVWRKARALAREVYAATRDGTFRGDAALRNQMRRASVSVMSNIAEGFERGASANEYRRFLVMAKGSCGEIRSQLYVARDQGYVSEPVFRRLASQAVEVSCMLQSLAAKLRPPPQRSPSALPTSDL